MRVIFHVDIDAFFASVEEIEEPSLKGKPLIIGGKPDKRGVVASANYAARAFGVRSAMTTARALRRCPQAIVRPLRLDLYQEYSEQFMDILRESTPLVESLSLDEAFLDMTEYIPADSTSEAVAGALQARIQTELGLSVSIGVATSKLVAKMASDSKKPSGLTYVPPHTEASFLAPLPVRTLWGIGPKTAQKLSEMGVKTIRNLANLPEIDLIRKFGVSGAKMWRHAKGIDHQPVQAARSIKSFGQETTFSDDVSDPQRLEETLYKMSQELAQRLQEKNFTARRITLKFRYSDFSTLTRSVTNDPATNSPDDIYRRTKHLWQQYWNTARPIRLIGVRVSQLIEGVQQLSLF